MNTEAPTGQEYQLPAGQFTGLQVVAPGIMDNIHGAETSILNVTRNESLDWRPEVPTFKCQLMIDSHGVSHGDTESCVSFSATNNLACQLDWLIAHGQIDTIALQFLKDNGYIDATGHVNLSPRFTSKMSGTTPQAGNSLPAVWNSIIAQGVVPESAWPMPIAAFDALAAKNDSSVNDYWAAYFAGIEPTVVALGAKFASLFTVQFEWLAVEGNELTMAQLENLLNVAPIQIATAVCANWNTADPIEGCGDGAQHATTLLDVAAGSAYNILDHYPTYEKQLAPNYSISYAVRGVIATPQPTDPATPSFTYNYETNITFGAPAGPNVTALQQGLQTVKDKIGTPYMTPGVFGPFGPQTLRALAHFQVDTGINDAPQGHDFGPLTRAALTKALEKLANPVTS